MIGPGGLLLVVPHVYVVLVLVLLVGLPKKKTTKLRHLVLLSKVTYLEYLGMLLDQTKLKIICIDLHYTPKKLRSSQTT